MKKIIAKKDFTIENEYYYATKEINIFDLDYLTIVNLNEKGFIEPLTRKDLVEIKEKLENPKKNFREEEV